DAPVSVASLFSSLVSCAHPDLHSFPTRRSSDLSLQHQSGRPDNAMINAGAIATVGLIKGSGGKDRITRISRTMELEIRVMRSLRSEEHTSELQSRFDLVCRLLLEKKKETMRRLT